jgi:hypothetical protein
MLQAMVEKAEVVVPDELDRGGWRGRCRKSSSRNRYFLASVCPHDKKNQPEAVDKNIY